MAPRRRGARGGGDPPAALKKGPWEEWEDDVLRAHVKKNGPRDWSSLLQADGGGGPFRRSGKSCRLRWVNKLKPGLKEGKFSEEEENTVIELQQELGNKWAEIARHLHGRTDNDVKNFWSSRRKKLQRALPPPPPPPPQRRPRSVGRSLVPSSYTLSDGLRALKLKEPVYDVGESSGQQRNEILCLPAPADAATESDSDADLIGAPLPGVLYLPGPVAATAEPNSDADLAVSQTCGTSLAPSHGLGAPQEPEPNDGEPPTAAAKGPEPPVTYSKVPLGVSCLASLHFAAFIEPLAQVPDEPLSFGMNDKVLPAEDPDPFSHLGDYFPSAKTKGTTQLRFGELSQKDLAFFDWEP